MPEFNSRFIFEFKNDKNNQNSGKNIHLKSGTETFIFETFEIVKKFKSN